MNLKSKETYIKNERDIMISLYFLQSHLQNIMMRWNNTFKSSSYDTFATFHDILTQGM